MDPLNGADLALARFSMAVKISSLTTRILLAKTKRFKSSQSSISLTSTEVDTNVYRVYSSQQDSSLLFWHHCFHKGRPSNYSGANCPIPNNLDKRCKIPPSPNYKHRGIKPSPIPAFGYLANNRQPISIFPIIANQFPSSLSPLHIPFHPAESVPRCQSESPIIGRNIFNPFLAHRFLIPHHV